MKLLDTRSSGGEWYLYAHILNPLTSGDNKLENSLLFTEGSSTNTLSTSPLLVHAGKFNSASKQTKISWDNLNGFLLSIEPQKDYPAGTYTTELLWQVSTEKFEP